MNFGIGPYTLLFTFQTVASQLVTKVKTPFEMFLGEKSDLSNLKILGVLLSNTLKRINTNFPTKPPRKFCWLFLGFRSIHFVQSLL